MLRLWHPEGDAADGSATDAPWPAVARKLEERLAEAPGVHRLGVGLFAVLPRAGDSAVIDAAVALGRRFFTELDRRGGAGELAVRCLAHPGRVTVQGERVRLIPDDLTRALDAEPPSLTPGRVHVSGRSAHWLEVPWRLTPAGTVDLDAGRTLPVLRVEQEEEERPPWRNREIWSRQVSWLPRPDVEEELTEHSRVRALRVTGPLGSGKTRSVIHSRAAAFPVLHLAVASVRCAAGTFAGRLLRRWARRPEQAVARRELLQLADQADTDGDLPPGRLIAALGDAVSRQGPVTVMLDDLHGAREETWTGVRALFEVAAEEPALRLVLAGRSGVPWPGAPGGLDRVPCVEIPPLEPEEARELLARLLPGVQLPGAVAEGILARAGGNPLLLEEAVVDLIQRHRVRRFYGAFVFSGGDDPRIGPTLRWGALGEGEGARLGRLFPLRLLALADGAVPPREVASAAKLVARDVPAAWEETFLDAGWLERRESPWGTAVAFRSEGWAAPWRASVAPESREMLRRTLGELLSVLGSGEGLWRSYRLLSGDPEAIPLLLRTAAESRGKESQPEGELIDALRTELRHHRKRGGDPDTELRLLWRLMPLARRAGRLGEFSDDLDRALSLAQGEPRRIVALSLLRAELDHGEGSYRDAEEALRRALVHSESIAEPQKALLLVQLGHLLMRQERNAEAVALFLRILPTLEAAGLRSLAATCHFHMGNIALAEKRLKDAAREHRLALEERRQLGALTSISASLTALGAVALARGRYPGALAYYQEAEEVARQTEDETELAFALRGLGQALTRLGDYPAAAGPLRRCLALRAGEDRVGEAMARLEVAENYLLLNNPAEALEEARKALFDLNLLESTGSADVTRGTAECLLGRIHARRRHLDKARKHFLAALEVQVRLGATIPAALTRAELARLELAEERRSELVPLVRDLATFLEKDHFPEQGERLDFTLHRALTWLGEPVEGARDALFYLRRAYQQLMEKTAHLEPALRNRFLQISDHEAIVTAATREGLVEGG